MTKQMAVIGPGRSGTGYPGFDIDCASQAFYQWKKHEKEKIMGFGDNRYRSVLNGVTVPKHCTP